jgi:hypothetical protein
MFLAIGKPVPPKAKFDVPHKAEPMRFREIVTQFPEFVAIFDGEAEENTLLFYYKFNKQRSVYEFKDADAEEEVAELLGVQIAEFEEESEENADAQHEDRPLTEEEIQTFREHLADIKQGREWLEGKVK